MTLTTSGTTTSTPVLRPGQHALTVLAGVVAGSIGWVAFLFQHRNWERTEKVPYEELAAARGQWLTSHFWWAPLAALGMVSFGIAVARLLRGPGRSWGTAAAALLVIGSLGFAAGLAAEGVLYYAATDDLLTPGAGADLLEHLMETGLYFPVFGIGLAGFTLGSLAAAMGLARSRSVPLWVPVLLTLGVVASAVAPHSFAWLATLPYPVAAITVAWLGVRAGAEPPS